MWKVRRGFLAWLLFALACLVPGWLLNDRLAAEVQIECGYPPLWQSRQWRHLGPTGRDYLCRVLRGSSKGRARLAFSHLGAYDDPEVLRSKIEAIQCFGLGDRFDPLPQGPLKDWGSIGAALDGMTDEELLRLITASDPSLSPGLVNLLLRVRPEKCERVVSTLLRSTGDVGTAKAALSGMYQVTFCLPDHRVYPIDDGERRTRVVRAGLSNVHAEIRDLCERQLSIEKGRRGGK